MFCGDEPLRFSRQRSKELLAYLIDRRGAQTSMAEIASVLWEDGQYNPELFMTVLIPVLPSAVLILNDQ